MIAVKKSDGSFEHITLEELKKRQSASSKIAARVSDVRERARPKPEMKIIPHKDDFVMPDMLPQKFVTPPTPATTTPHNDFIHSKNVTSPSLSGQLVPTPAPKFSPMPRLVTNTLSQSTLRPMVNDIISHPQTMSPLDEIKFFTLTDFRRLSSSPVEAAARLKQKFTNLKEESIIWYFSAFDSWHASPLYLDYMNAVASALVARSPLVSVTGSPNGIQIKEIDAITVMEKELI